MQQQQPDVPPEYQEIQKIVQDFKHVISFNLRNNQGHLVQELQQKARRLKQSIQFYKKQTSNQNIQKLISKKRHQKQSERLELEIQWRNLTEKYKKLQQEQKKIYQQNRQNKFDVQNLQNKIKQLQNDNFILQRKINNLKEQINNSHFITQAQANRPFKYKSPYKFTPKSSPKHQNPITPLFPSKIQSISKAKYLLLNNNENNSHLQKSQFKIFTHQNKHLDDPSIFNKENYLKQIKIKNNKSSVKDVLIYYKNNDKWKQLMNYIDRPDIKMKIFELIRKEQ